jgi:hypothetical protein
MKSAHLKKIPLILLAGLDHFADLMPLKEFIPEVLETIPQNKMLGKKPKRTNRFALAQKIDVDDIDVAPDKDAEFTRKTIQALNDLATQKTFIRGVHVPILAGVKNRAIAASFPFLGALNLIRDLESILKNRKMVEAMAKSKDPSIRDLGEVLNRLATGVSMIDFHAVYTHIDANWDLTIQEGISERDKTDGRLERAEDKEKGTKTVLLLIFGVVGLIIAGGIVLWVLTH